MTNKSTKKVTRVGRSKATPRPRATASVVGGRERTLNAARIARLRRRARYEATYLGNVCNLSGNYVYLTQQRILMAMVSAWVQGASR